MLITSMTACGKTWHLLDMLEREYPKHFDYIALICPTFSWNDTYSSWRYRDDPDFIALECSQDNVDTVLGHVLKVFKGYRTLIILDDCAGIQAVKNRTTKLVKLAFSARHYNLSTIVVTLQLASISKPYRENISKLVAFYNPNRVDMKAITDDYLYGLDKDDVKRIPDTLKSKKYSRLEISLRHPDDHKVVVSKPGSV